MVLETIRKNGKSCYSIIEVDRGQNLGMIACYDSLEQAATVLRYLKGGNMPKESQQKALRYIFEWDARESILNGE